METGALHGGALEVRRRRDGSARLAGRFPYQQTAILSDGGRRGRPRKERFAPRAFSYRIDRPGEEIHLLSGHDYSRPLASRGTRTLEIEDTDAAVEFEATIPATITDVGHIRDVLALLETGLAIGLSPGFRLPPERAVRDAETIEEEPYRPEEGMHRAIIRTINAALLYEMSIVTSAAYSQATVEARDWQASVCAPMHAALRWRT
ncbi:MAG: HK97 family phage prohead protease [Pseudomonadota bacterium]